MKWYAKLGLLASLLMGMNILKWLWGCFCILREPRLWLPYGVDVYIPAIVILEHPLMLIFEIVLMLIAMMFVVIALIKKD